MEPDPTGDDPERGDDGLEEPRGKADGLFFLALHRDWAFLLGAFVTFMLGVSTGREFGDPYEASRSDWTPLATGLMIGGPIAFGIAGVAPAMLRRRWSKSASKGRPRRYQTTANTGTAVMVVLVLGAVVGAVQAPEVNQTNGPTEIAGEVAEPAVDGPHCRENDAYRICLTFTQLAPTLVNIDGTFRYRAGQVIAGNSVSEIVWTGQLSCEPRSASVPEFALYSPTQVAVSVDKAITDVMKQGLIEGELEPLLQELCG